MTTTDATLAPRRWGAIHRFLFCFAFAYLLLYNLPFPLHFTPLGEWAMNGWDAAVKFTGRAMFGLTITILPAGSGDTTWNYVQLVVIAALAAAIAIVWSLLDRRRDHYEVLHRWLRVYIRFALAAAMISYGAVKVIQSQFPPPSTARLMQTFGDASPMGLLWTFMGASAAYNLFSGLVEMTGGLLLTARRTTLLGALVSAGAMANIAVLNFCYDVPVKLYSTHLLLMALFLMLPDLGRLTRFFVLNQPVPPSAEPPLIAHPRVRMIATAIGALVVVGYTMLSLSGAKDGREMFASRNDGFALAGAWNVDELSVDGRTLPESFAEGSRWRRVVLDEMEMIVFLTSDTRNRYRISNYEPTKHRFVITPRERPLEKFFFSYEQPSPSKMVLSGEMNGRKIEARLTRMDVTDFPLNTRGFHWINEFPYNR